MADHLIDWLDLLIRWTHVVTGIAWIGASFYFNWLEGRLERTGTKPEGIAGDLWSVHGGGFYHVQKYEVAPPRLPDTLHWFKWEAYTTWLSGFALLLAVYYLDPGLMLLGENPLDLSTPVAMGLALALLPIGWAIYHALCRSPLVDRPVAFAAIGLLTLAGLGWGLVQVYDDRAAFLHLGALIGTLMAGNVLFVIIPAQKQMVEAMERGETPDPRPGRDALNRSLHNNYLTLPVLFIMISHHYPMTYAHGRNWLILAALAAGSALLRHVFNLRNRGRWNVWILPAVAVALLAAMLISRPAAFVDSGSDTVRFWQVREVVARHCQGCHSAWPSHPVFTFAPQGFLLDTPEQIRAGADKIMARAVQTPSMPLGNETGMTPEERALLGRWIESGMPD